MGPGEECEISAAAAERVRAVVDARNAITSAAVKLLESGATSLLLQHIFCHELCESVSNIAAGFAPTDVCVCFYHHCSQTYTIYLPFDKQTNLAISLTDYFVSLWTVLSRVRLWP